MSLPTPIHVDEISTSLSLGRLYIGSTIAAVHLLPNNHSTDVVYYKQNSNDPWLFRYPVAFLCKHKPTYQYAVWPNTLTFIAIDLVLPKREFYINSLLAMLNSRRSTGEKVGRRVPHKMIRFAPHDTESGLVDSGQTSTALPGSSVTGVGTDISIPLPESEGCRSNGNMDDMAFA
ncbi:hypothetical protein IW262DRAFT_1302594 [Armillaria fumosa]|nr:hypothetical protein IW262DRAFT_1302594 [Armillaria fumosa]